MSNLDQTIAQFPRTPNEGPKVTFRVLQGTQKGAEIVVEKPSILILGRDGGASFCVGDDPFFSKLHCRLEIVPPRCRLVDLNSTNGTFINDIRTQETMDLVHGDRIGGGSTLIEFNVIENTENLSTQAFVQGDLERGIHAINELVGTSNSATVLSSESGDRSNAFPLNRASTPCKVGEFIGAYEVVRELGRGGMGVVYLGRHKRTQDLRAIKLVLPVGGNNPSQVQMFLREANLLMQLKHPRIVEAHEIGLHRMQPYLVMEYLNTLDLEDTIRKQSRAKAIRMACWIVVQVLEALGFAHSLGTIHRDVKPANVLAFRKDQRMLVKLADFGLAKKYQDAGFSSLTKDNDIRGTLVYMSPEQILDSRYSQPSVDLYSAAATLYYLLSGKNHFEWSRQIDAVKLLLNETPIPLQQSASDIPLELAEIVDRALSRIVSNRFPTAVALREAIRPYSEKLTNTK